VSEFQAEASEAGIVNETQELGRELYLHSLQRWYPDFWRDLRDALKADTVSDWVEAYSVRDQWLLERIGATLEMWSAEPSGPAARLDPSAMWFQPSDYLVPFRPAIDPFPRAGETHAEFGSRICADFAQQFESWRSLRVRDMGEFESHEQRQACTWLVRHLAGESYSQIALELMIPSEDPKQYVKRAALRFAAKIGLTIGTKRSKFCTSNFPGLVA